MGGKVVLSLPRKIHYSGWKFWVRILPQSRALRPNRAGLPVNFGRGVTRAVYLLVNQSFSALSLCRRLRLLLGQPAKGSIFAAQPRGVAMGSHEAAAGHSETRTPH